MALAGLLPRVLRPKWIALTWRWRRSSAQAGRFGQAARDLILGALTFGLAVLCYRGTLWVLRQTETALDFAYLPPSLIIGLIFVLLFFMLIVTNTVAALGALYLSSDLEVILSSPLKPPRFFFGKLVEIMVLSSWMSMIFLFPVLFAFARHFHGSLGHASLWYVAACVAVLIPYFVIPAALAMVLATVMTLVAPWVRRREIGALFAIAFSFVIWRFGTLLGSELNSGGSIDISDILRMVSFLSITNTRWAPAHWCSTILGEYLVSSGRNSVPYFALLYSSTIFLVSVAYLTIRTCHFAAYSRAGMLVRGTLVRSRQSRAKFQRLFAYFSKPTRALIAKEYKLCMRDLTQVLQFVMLLALCAMYIYMLSLQTLFETAIPQDQRRWWKIFLVCTNLCIESFVITAMGTRLVFPSISREGRAYWVLENAPLTIRHILRVKFWFWYIPLALICSTVFSSATIVMYGSVAAGAIKFGTNLVLSAALVGMGLGCGALFAKFDWEHPSELIAGFGSLVYMVSAVLLIVLNLCGSGIVVYLRILRTLEPEHATTLNLLSALALLAIMIIDVAIGYWSLRIGESALLKRNLRA